MVWRGDLGLPWIRSYDLEGRDFSAPRMLLGGTGIEIDARRFARDQHYSPIVWKESDGRSHVAFGFRRTAGYHLASLAPGDIGQWVCLADISHWVSYPQVRRIAGGWTLVYFREGGHLAFWRFRVSGDASRTWERPPVPDVDMDALPRTSSQAAHTGSYQTTWVSEDGRKPHVAFVWSVEEPVESERYGGVLHGNARRHNLFHVSADLESGEVFDAYGKKPPKPVNLAAARRGSLVWDTGRRSAAVGPSYHLARRESRSFSCRSRTGRPTLQRSILCGCRIGNGSGWRLQPPVTPSTPPSSSASRTGRSVPISSQGRAKPTGRAK